MTLTMADSITPANLPGGYDAYLGYVDGAWPTAPLLSAKFPGKQIVSLTVRGGSAVADGCDIENGDLSPVSGAQYAAGDLVRGGRPVLYASTGTMTSVLDALPGAGVARSRVRLLSAHYGAGRHICGPASCGLVSVTMDGTQWTDTAAGNGGTLVDASLLAPDFFGAVPSTDPVLRLGATGTAVTQMQSRLNAWGAHLATDGVFGALTLAAVEAFQRAHGLTADGVCGSATWAVLDDNPATWTYGPPVNLRARAGHKSVELTWSAPAAPEPPAQYAIYVYAGTICDKSTQVASYPRTVRGTAHLEGSLQPKRTYTAHVVAEGSGGSRVAKFTYASVSFTTG